VRRKGILSPETDIAQLEEALNTVATEIYVDGQKISLDMAAILRSLVVFKRRQVPRCRPVVSTIDLSRC
jgi:hypothetical protein